MTMDEEGRWNDVRGVIEPNMHRLTAWEHKFMTDQFERADEDISSFWLSPKQWEIINRIENKILG